ncbi:MAG: phosphopantetheine-binding protein [Gammaproteobacteria bacterium]|nr:phosphopantetheine-binding protein [Gammaproteobacteria bacterium]
MPIVRETLMSVIKRTTSERPTLESTFSDLHLDSLDKVEIIMALEDDLCIEIPDELWENHSPKETLAEVLKKIEPIYNRTHRR